MHLERQGMSDDATVSWSILKPVYLGLFAGSFSWTSFD